MQPIAQQNPAICMVMIPSLLLKRPAAPAPTLVFTIICIIDPMETLSRKVQKARRGPSDDLFAKYVTRIYPMNGF